MSATLERRLRRRERYDLEAVITDGFEEDDEVDEDESDREDVEVHARAQCEIARSTMVEMAPSLPPNTEEFELELDELDEELEETDSGRGVLGGDGGSGGPPR